MRRTVCRRYSSLLVTVGLLLTMLPGSIQAGNEQPPDTGPTLAVNVDLALSSLASLGDGHLKKMADSLHILATSAGRPWVYQAAK